MKFILSFTLLFTLTNWANSQSLCTYYLELSHQNTAEGNYQKGIFYADKALKLYPDSSRCYFERGGANFFSGRLEEAYVDFNTFVGMEPQNPDGYYWRGMVLSSFRLYAKAESDYLKCTELGGSDDFVKFKLAETYLFLEKYEPSEKLLLELITSQPKNINYYNLLGLLNEDKQNYDKSVELFSEGIAIDSNCVSCFYNRARIHMELGNKTAACEDWTMALQLGAEDSEIWLGANNCAGIKGLSESDIAFDKQERSKGKKAKKQKREITSDYLPMLNNAHYTYTSNFEGKIDTAAMTVRYIDYQSNDFYFDHWNDFNSDLELLYFEILHTNDIRYTKEKLELLVKNSDQSVVATPLFPRVFALGKEQIIENTWNPKSTYEMKNTSISLEGIETYKMPNGSTTECVKLRIEMSMNNGRSDLSYLWLVKDFGMVKWRNSTGRIWELIRYAVPEFGSFPPEEEMYLMPPPAEEEDPR